MSSYIPRSVKIDLDTNFGHLSKFKVKNPNTKNLKKDKDVEYKNVSYRTQQGQLFDFKKYSIESNDTNIEVDHRISEVRNSDEDKTNAIKA